MDDFLAARLQMTVSFVFPVMVYIEGGQNLTIWNTQAPEKTMTMLLYALLVGIIIILPAFAYLFKVFKFSNEVKGLE